MLGFIGKRFRKLEKGLHLSKFHDFGGSIAYSRPSVSTFVPSSFGGYSMVYSLTIYSVSTSTVRPIRLHPSAQSPWPVSAAAKVSKAAPKDSQARKMQLAGVGVR